MVEKYMDTWTGRIAFTPNNHHCVVCSEHFPEGKMTYLNNRSNFANQTPILLHQRTVLGQLNENTNKINIVTDDKINSVQSAQQENNPNI